jgi:DNA-binding NarL/FixJ family response regulator
VDVVVLDFNDDGSESALIASELKRLRPRIPIAILVAEGKPLVHGATQQADAVVVKSEENLRLVDALRRLLPAS